MEIIPNIHHLSKGISGANVYLLSGEKLTLVDTGMPGNAEAILGYVRSLGRAPSDLARIILTHYHVDHVGSLAELVGKTHAQVLAHPADIPFINGERPQPGPRGRLMRLLFGLVFRLAPGLARHTPAAVDVPLEDGASLDILGGARVVHAPGHTPGSIALHLPVERLLVVGDTLNCRGGRLSGPAAAFTQDMQQAIASVRRLAGLDFDVLCPGHGQPIVGGAAGRVQALAREL